MPDRRGVYDILTKQAAFLERKAKRRLFTVEDYAPVARRLHSMGVSGADIAEVLRLSAEMNVRRIIEAPDNDLIDPSFVYVSEDDIYHVIEGYADRITLSKDSRTIGFQLGGVDHG